MTKSIVRPIAGPQVESFVPSRFSHSFAKTQANVNLSRFLHHLGKKLLPNTISPITLGMNSEQYFQTYVDGSKEMLGIVLNPLGYASGVMFVKSGHMPTPFYWDAYSICTPNNWDSNGCAFQNPVAGNWYILVQGLGVGPAELLVSYEDLIF